MKGKGWERWLGWVVARWESTCLPQTRPGFHPSSTADTKGTATKPHYQLKKKSNADMARLAKLSFFVCVCVLLRQTEYYRLAKQK